MNRNTKHVSTPFGDIAYTEHGIGPAALLPLSERACVGG